VVQKKSVKRIISKMRAILSKNKDLLEDEVVKEWLKVVYPLVLEHASASDKEFFERIYPYLFNEFKNQS